MVEKKKISIKFGGFKCNICVKSFPTPQALGGHKASHNRNKNTESSNPIKASEGGSRVVKTIHQCKMCSMTFSTGMGLGGHKKAHQPRPVDTPLNAITLHKEASPRDPTEFHGQTGHLGSKILDFDLNLPYVMEDEDFHF